MELKTNNIGKTFSGVNVLRNVDFDLKPGVDRKIMLENIDKKGFLVVPDGYSNADYFRQRISQEKTSE